MQIPKVTDDSDLQGGGFLRHSAYDLVDVAKTLDEIRRKRREAMPRYRAQLRPQYQPLAPTEIRQLRERLGLSQRAFAHRVGVAMGTITRWGKGHTTPRFLAVERLRELQRESEAP